MRTYYDVCIMGGGAAGLSAAASLDKEISVCILEKNEIPGRKIMATGGGRCNITNERCAKKDMTLDFFKCLGLETHRDAAGRYYPYTNRASDVVKALVTAAETAGTDILTGFAVKQAACEGGRFIVTDGSGRVLQASCLLLASGGKAAPQLGTTGDGYVLARNFGHEVTRLYPVLTALECGRFTGIKGVRAKGTVKLYKDDVLLAEEHGEIQFTEDGISGICVFDITPYIRADAGEDLKTALQRYYVELDLAPDFSHEALEGRTGTFGILTEALAARVDLADIKRWRLPVMGVKGWKYAQCTAGGVSLSQIHADTMESMLVPGLYFAGEILDVQGPCGGYNLQNAWETGIKAAEAINRRYEIQDP